MIETTDEKLKSSVHDYWNEKPCGTQFIDNNRGSKEFFEAIEKHRYSFQPYSESLCRFKAFDQKRLLEIGCGLGTDSLQFARHGAIVTGVDLTEESVALARERFKIYGFEGSFQTADAENLPFDSNSFDVVYSFGVLHHTPNTLQSIHEVYRVLKPGGEVVIMLYHKHSLHVWLGVPLFFLLGLTKGKIWGYDEWIRIYDGKENPLGKAYSKKELKKMFSSFKEIKFAVCDNLRPRFPKWLNDINQKFFSSWAGFYIMIYAKK